jgi:hypothetical protein
MGFQWRLGLLRRRVFAQHIVSVGSLASLRVLTGCRGETQRLYKVLLIAIGFQWSCILQSCGVFALRFSCLFLGVANQ